MPREVVTDFEHLKKPVHTAIGEEIHMFTHIHLRGYDKNGGGKQMHADYYDKYGAPMKIQDSWLCLLYTSPSPRDGLLSRMPSSA